MYHSISIKKEVYDKLKEIQKEKHISLSAIIENIIDKNI